MSFVNKVQKAAWDSLISYKTQRIILIKDFKLGVFHKSLLIGVGIYLIYTILTSHAYMIKESPATTINSWVDGTEFLRKLNETKAGTRSEPWYCDDSTVEYVYSPSFTYLDNKCDLESNVAEVFDEESTAVSFVTYYQDSALDKVGEGEDVNNFIPYVEDITLFFSHGFTTALGVEGANVEAVVKSRDGSKQKKFDKGEAVSLSITELLEMTGIELEDRHEDSGGLAPEEHEDSHHWPLFRMTGVDITMEMDYQNFRSGSPFDFTNRLEASVSATRGVWVSRGQSIFPKWQNGKVVPHLRYPQVISVSYRASGQLGRVDAFEAVMNIAVSAAIFGVAKFICDFAGDWIVHEFYDKRYLDHGDFLAIQTLKEKVWDQENERERSTRDLVSKALEGKPAEPAGSDSTSGKKWHVPHMLNVPAWFRSSKNKGGQLSPQRQGQTQGQGHASWSPENKPEGAVSHPQGQGQRQGQGHTSCSPESKPGGAVYHPQPTTGNVVPVDPEELGNYQYSRHK